MLAKAVHLLFTNPGELARKASRRLSRRFRPMQGEYRRKWSRTLADWLISHQRDVVFQDCTWMGLKAWKNPLDAWIYQEILHDVQPEVLVEIGSAHGGSTLYFAHLFDLLGKGRVVSVDFDRTNYRAEHTRIVTVTGDSSSAEVVAQVRAHCAGKSVLVIHDGGHDKQQVLKDMAAYADLVGVGSYFIVEDGIIDLFRPGDGLGVYEDGPLAATEEFLESHPEFEVDATRERYVLTYNPRGFLKRVR
jgi:cephalosporin hydroxylase